MSERCPLCEHPYDAHDFDIHNGDLGFYAGFPFELTCYECIDWGVIPPLGTPEHDFVALKNLEREGHYCHIGPLPRWVESEPRQWEPEYQSAPIPSMTSASNRTYWASVEVRV